MKSRKIVVKNNCIFCGSSFEADEIRNWCTRDCMNNPSYFFYTGVPLSAQSELTDEQLQRRINCCEVCDTVLPYTSMRITCKRNRCGLRRDEFKKQFVFQRLLEQPRKRPIRKNSSGFVKNK